MSQLTTEQVAFLNSTSLYDLLLGRARTTLLKRYGLHYVWHAGALGSRLAKIRGIGEGTVRDVRARFEELGIDPDIDLSAYADQLQDYRPLTQCPKCGDIAVSEGVGTSAGSVNICRAHGHSYSASRN